MTFNGDTFTVGGSTDSQYAIELGGGRSGNGYAFIDLVGDTTYTDYGLRMIRGNTGANTSSNIVHRGTGDFKVETQDLASLKFNVNNKTAIPFGLIKSTTLGVGIPIFGDFKPPIAENLSSTYQTVPATTTRSTGSFNYSGVAGLGVTDEGALSYSMVRVTREYTQSTIVSSAGSSTTFLNAAGSNQTLMFTNTFWYAKFNTSSGTNPTISGNMVLRQAIQSNPNATVSNLPSTIINAWYQQQRLATSTAFYYRDVPSGGTNVDARIYAPNTTTNMFFGSGMSSLGTRITHIGIRAEYVVMDALNMIV